MCCLARPHLRCGIPWSSRSARCRSRLRTHANVSKLDRSATSQKNIAGLYVSVNFSMAVQVAKSSKNTRQNPEHLLSTLGTSHEGSPVRAVNELHRVVAFTSWEGRAGKYLNQILMADMTQDVEFSSEPHSLCSPNDLQSNLSLERSVENAIDPASTSGTKKTLDLKSRW